MPGPLLNVNALIQCAHGGKFVVAPRGPRPLIGGAPGITVDDLPGTPAVGCVWNVLGVPTPCVIVAPTAGMVPRVLYSGSVAVDQTLICMTSNGIPSLPVSSPGQMTVHCV